MMIRNIVMRLLYISIFVLAIHGIYAGNHSNIKNVKRFHTHIMLYKTPYSPQNMQHYKDFLSQHFKININKLDDIKFYRLQDLDMQIACNFQRNPKKWAIAGCYYDYNSTIYIEQYRSCETELHELVHASISLENKWKFRWLTNIMNVMHKHKLYRHKTIEDFCRIIQ